jgi:CMP-N-acetylneuraminic acid synthetase
MTISKPLKVYGFIFARGGSKGLPKKNIKLLNGKPLIHYAIESAISCPEISRIFVSTDDCEIATAAKDYDVEIINRPSELASDASAEWLSWAHAVEYVRQKYHEFDVFVSVPTTSPLRGSCDISSSIDKLLVSDADTCIAVTDSSRSPYFNMVSMSGDYVNLLCNQIGGVIRRQDAPPVYDITTVVYTTYPSFILENNGVFSGKVTAIKVPRNRAVDIDDIFDFKFAELMMKESGVENE